MDAQIRHCIDVLDQMENNPYTKQHRNVLVGLLRELFVEPHTYSLRLSALATFCYNYGVDLVTHHCEVNHCASFTIRSNHLTVDVCV